MRLSIVIPAYNEERRIQRMLDAYLPFFTERYGGDVEFVIVVNGSTDRTAAVAESYVARWPCVRVLVEPSRIGKGGAVMMGMDAARGELVGFVDADGATPPDAFDQLAQHIGDAGIMIANRWDPRSRITPQPWSRRAASRAFNGLVRFLFRVQIDDTQCGAKVMAQDAIRAIRPHLGITQWAFDVDLIFQIRRAGFRIAEAPTVWNDVAGSRLRLGRASFEMLLAIVRLRLLNSRLRWVVAVYDRTLARVFHYRP